MKNKYTIGIDFGTDSVRVLILEVYSGEIIANVFSTYELWKKGKYCNPNKYQFRQHPIDHVNALKSAMIKALAPLPKEIIRNIKAISVASTGSTPVAVDIEGVPLAMLDEFKENPNAMFILWKDHTSIQEAGEINNIAHSPYSIDYTKYVGGEYSSEWFWAKILHVLRTDEKVRNTAFSWVEHCDWIPALLTGNTNPLTIKRSRCAAGHKAMWHPEWGGLPPNSFLSKIDPLFSEIRSRLYADTLTADQQAGTISGEWAEMFGLQDDVIIGVGTLDAHMGAIGGEIRPNYLVKVIGTSTCDMIVVPKEEMEERVVSGICGQVDGSILPNMIGLEAGQSAFGDIYAWFRNLISWPTINILEKIEGLDTNIKEILLRDTFELILPELSNAAKNIPIDESGLVAIDWMNGRRTPNSNQHLKGALAGISLSTDAPNIFKALVEATCFGSKKIIEKFKEEGVKIEGIIAVGGVAQKSEFVMQTLADILDYPVKVVKAEQTCALGAAMSAAVVSDLHESYDKAQSFMGAGFQKEYMPTPVNVNKYKMLYNKYSEFSEFIEQNECNQRKK